MKKALILLNICILFSVNLKAQITLEHVIDPYHGFLFYPVNISMNETKYLSIDTVNNSFSLLNLDLSAFISNIQLPVTLFPYYTITYVSRTLFDCDTSNIEFFLESPNDVFSTCYIVRTDGTILFQRDSAVGPYCFGCYGGTQDLRPIFNSEQGAKLQLMLYHPPGRTYLEIYSLCGTLVQTSVNPEEQPPSFVKVYPNPTTRTVQFEINSPSNYIDYTLRISDNTGKEIKSEYLKADRPNYSLDILPYSAVSICIN